MARIETFGFDDDLFGFDTEGIGARCLEAASPIVEESMKRVIRMTIRNKDRSTGELVNSITRYKPTKNKQGYDQVFIGPKGNSTRYYYHTRNGKRSRRYQLSQAAKLIFMEYGTSHQPATPVLAKATNDAREAVYKAMQDVIDREVGD